jgi:4-aminobutyrate aminotransferase-like enzyme
MFLEAAALLLSAGSVQAQTACTRASLQAAAAQKTSMMDLINGANAYLDLFSDKVVQHLGHSLRAPTAG